MKEFVCKRKKVFFLIGIYLLFLLFVSQDAWLYDTTIAKITKVQTEKTGEKEGARGETEAYYRQTMQGILPVSYTHLGTFNCSYGTGKAYFYLNSDCKKYHCRHERRKKYE